MSAGGVGRSHRTAVKHGLYNRILGREAALIRTVDFFDDLLVVDMTAGDGQHLDDSPRIAVKHMTNLTKCGYPARGEFFEQDEGTWDSLIGNVGEPAGVNIIWGDSRAEALYVPPPTRRTVAFVLDDPNTGGGSTITVDTLEWLRSNGCWASTVFCAIGANAGGRLRADGIRDKETAHYLDLIDWACGHGRHPLYCRIVGDNARWAYLVLTAKNGKMRAAINRDMLAVEKDSGVPLGIADGQQEVTAAIENLYKRGTR